MADEIKEVNHDSVMNEIMNELDADKTQEIAENTEAESQETVEPTLNEEIDSTEVEEEQGDEVVTSDPKTNNEVNKEEALKALKGKVKELTQKLKEKEAATVESKDSNENALEQFAKLFDKTPEEIKAAIKAKEAEKAGVDVDTYDMIEGMRKELAELKQSQANKELESKQRKLENTISTFIDETGLTQEADVLDFFKTAKDDYGIDLTNNPNIKTMKALFNGAIGEKYRDKVEQAVLQKIKEGEEPNLESSEVNIDSRIKKQEKQFDDWLENTIKSVNNKIHGK